jgi:hypothetical protein
MRVLVCLLAVLTATPLLGCPAQPQAAPADSAAKPAEAAKAADVPTEVVPDLPDFPGSVMTSYGEKGPGEGWTKTWKRETRVTAPYQDVRKFYQEQIEKKGWRISSSKEKPGEIKWGLTRGTSWGEIEVDAEHGVVKVSVERKDR